MQFSRRSAIAALVVLGPAFLALACSSFSADAPPPPGDGGAASEGGPVPEGGPATDAQAPPCDATKVDADPLNCGRCGHSCLGGACAGGKCQPAVLATVSASDLYGPVIDSARIVIATRDLAGPRVQWCPKTGCPAGLTGADLPTAPESIGTDGTVAYVATLGGTSAGIFQLAPGGSVKPMTRTNGVFQNPYALTTRGTDVLFINAFQPGEIGIYRVPNDGSLTAALIAPVQQADRYQFLVALPDRVYVADFESIATCAGPSCATLTAYAVPSVASNDVTGLVTDGTKLFWTLDNGSLMACALGDTCPAAETVFTASSLEGAPATALSIHGPDLYVSTDSAIFSCVAASCGQDIHAVVHDDAAVLGRAAADDVAVYWISRQRIDAGGGLQPFRLMRLAR